eukprot:6206246-Pleurochrysis_carterae.AAC.5
MLLDVAQQFVICPVLTLGQNRLAICRMKLCIFAWDETTPATAQRRLPRRRAPALPPAAGGRTACELDYDLVTSPNSQEGGRF